MSNSKLKQRIIDHSIQAILIFTSVFLAFWMNENRIHKNNEQITLKARKAILNEMKNNLAILERWMPYHKNIFDNAENFFNTQLDTIKTFRADLIKGFDKGVQREIITNHAWDLIKDPNVNFNIETRMLINRIYEQQKYVDNSTKAITSGFLLQKDIFNSNLTKENYYMFFTLMGELYGQEKAMIYRLKEAIIKINK